jgi:transposase
LTSKEKQVTIILLVWWSLAAGKPVVPSRWQATRDLPERFGPWQTVWKRHHRFATDGTWDKLLRAIQAEADAAGRVDWTVSVDSSIGRAHQHAATAKREGRALLGEHTGGSVE